MAQLMIFILKKIVNIYKVLIKQSIKEINKSVLKMMLILK